MPDQKLKDAMEEIKPLLKKYDCAAIVLLASEAHMEYFYEITPTWACTTMEGDNRLRIRALSTMYPDKATQKKVVEATTGIFFGFIDMLAKASRDMTTVAQTLGTHFGNIGHWTKEE